MDAQKTKSRVLYAYKMSPNAGGIYVIVNLLKGEAYVGQAKSFSNRNHIDDLERGADNARLQEAYNNGDALTYIPIPIVSGESQISSEDFINRYERLYIHIARDHIGFKLYNVMHNEPEKPPQVLRAEAEAEFTDEDEIREAIKQFNEVFRNHFGKDAAALIRAAPAKREEILAKYLKKIKSFQLIVPYFSKKELEKNYGMKERSLQELAPKKLMVSSMGSYVGDTVQDILKYENKAIKDWGYCLWMFGKHINTALGRAFCEEIVADGGTPYVLLRYTHASTGKEWREGVERYIFPVFEKESFRALPEEVKRDLQVTESDEEGDYWVPGHKGQEKEREPMDCSAKGTSSRAFVVGRIDFVSECIDCEKFFEEFSSIVKNKPKCADIEPIKIGSLRGYVRKEAVDSFMPKNEKGERQFSQHTTGCIKLKSGRKDLFSEDRFKKLLVLDSQLPVFNDSNSKKLDLTDYILLTLKAPYIIDFDESKSYREINNSLLPG